MQTHTTAPSDRPAAKLSTEELSVLFRNRPQTIRASLCNKGHFCNMRPVKLPNGKLLWDSVEVAALLNGEVSA
jgi:hypothetical protein